MTIVKQVNILYVSSTGKYYYEKFGKKLPIESATDYMIENAKLQLLTDFCQLHIDNMLVLFRELKQY